MAFGFLKKVGKAVTAPLNKIVPKPIKDLGNKITPRGMHSADGPKPPMFGRMKPPSPKGILNKVKNGPKFNPFAK